MSTLIERRSEASAAAATAHVVRRGSVDLFAVESGAGRHHFLCRIETGGWFLPLAAPLDQDPSQSWEVLAVPGLGAEIERRTDALAAIPALALDGWVAALAAALTEVHGAARADLTVAPGSHLLASGTRCGGGSLSPVWATARSGTFALRGAHQASITAEAPPFPLSRPLWVECLEPGELDIADTLAESDIGPALAAFHSRAVTLIGLELHRRAAQAAIRQQRRRDLDQQVREDGLLALASVADVGTAAPPSPSCVPELAALHLVARSLDLTVRPAPAEERSSNLLNDVLKASGIRWRSVLLRGAWWQRDSGPLLAWWNKDDEADGAAAVALLPVDGGYVLHDPATGTVQQVDEAVSDALKGRVRMLYRRLPDAPVGAAALFSFGVRDAGGALRGLGWLGAATAALALSVPFATNLLVQEIIPRGMVGQHLVLVAGLLAAAVGAASFQLVRFLMTLSIEGRLDWALQAGLFDRLLRLPTTFFKTYSAGDLANRALGIQGMRERLSGAALGAMQSLLFSVFSLAALFFFNAKLALVGVALAVTSLVLTVGLAALQLRHEVRHADALGRVEGLVFQIMAGIGKLKVAASLDRAFSAWARLYSAQKRHFAASSRVSNRLTIFHAVFPGLSTIVLLAVAAVLIKSGATDQKLLVLAGAEATTGLTPGAMLAFLAAFGQFLAALNAVGNSLTDVLGAIPLYRRARPLLDAVPEDAGTRRDPGPLSGGVEFANVSFSYDQGGARILHDLSLTIEPGEWVALVGASGSGKSTLLRLLLGFERPDSGEVFLNGKALADLDPGAVRRQIGVMLQNGQVTGGSILSNIIGSADLGLDDAWNAARLVGLDRDIEAMPMGMHTVLMDGGTTLSGGQRQRLMLARALVRRPRLLVLDEATSALDNRAQAIVSDTLAALPITRIVIAHRLSSVEQAGRIVVLQNGAVVQQGRYHDLINTSGPFADMARRQTL